ncbi:hypothetical protein [Propionicimonas sp.]|uniref:hypothetical protein n=1 Tax=Propionicimonas sp. TaxID=1955623 RepID=UPI001830B055|nr:hypothetical protein [Propionicimonas sp.]MBU3976872.1 hypothetical protein [Actinomycetota bacterium]MBA3019561.1 hypothetical protein [Propionicimonas sp.]MBU3986967.1 hypothetical protein [Actinomycetota bacterium]MBU4006879.1 hypothetical protein [Actinomycetota bacterium]MBU4065579.1 hypothetical protein [Actinomycetota bacterium]
MKQIVVAIGLVVSLAFFAGCSVEAVGPGSPSSAGTPSSEPTESPSTAASETTTATSTGTDGDSSTRRSAYADDVDVTLSCPTGELVLEKTMTTTRITQDCNKVTVRGSLTVVLAERVGTLIVEADASSSLVLVRSADSVLVAGALADVYWDKGMPGKVEVTGSLASANPNPTPEG